MKIVGVSIIGLASLAATIGLIAPSTYASDDTTCVDASVASNLTVTWKSNGSVTVGTKDKPVCKDTTLFFSSYTMPDNYDGGGFNNNSTATPQQQFDNTSVVLKKGTSADVNLTVKLPDACKNMQIDLYYPPQITTVGPQGHGSQYITGKMLVKTADTCTPPPVAEQNPPTPPAPAPETPAVPASTPAPAAPVVSTVLPQTGSSFAGTLKTGALLSVVTYLAVYFVTKRRV